MRRIAIAPRTDWRAKVEALGFDYHGPEADPDQPDQDMEQTIWNEGAYYEFTAAEVDALEEATEELHRLCLAAVDRVCREPALMAAFRIPEAYRGYVVRSWLRSDPYLMGRFDLAYDPASGTIKMLEYNADTPTAVIETALVQWFWLQDIEPEADQFNSMHEKLIARLAEVGKLIPQGATLHFTCNSGAREDFQHSHYFLDLAGQAGLTVKFIDVEDIGWDDAAHRFVDLEGKPILFLHKLYPWEFMASEAFGPRFPEADIAILEPAWKMVLSNKALLPLLWEMFPGHPNLLAAHWEPGPLGDSYVAKPILSRGGSNVELRAPGREPVRTEGDYGDQPLIYQELATLPVFDGRRVLIGSWMVGDAAAGIIVRESESEIIVDTSQMVPHLFR